MVTKADRHENWVTWEDILNLRPGWTGVCSAAKDGPPVVAGMNDFACGMCERLCTRNTKLWQNFCVLELAQLIGLIRHRTRILDSMESGIRDQ